FRRVSGATDALFLFSIISKAGLEKSEDFSRPALFLETYVTASKRYLVQGQVITNDMYVLIPRAKMIVLCWFKEPSRSSIASTYQLLCHRLWLDGYKKTIKTS
ncbi:hypothetical protein, partial [Lactiplantibacillus plantarum]|uniref:hypothetical protein n=1 Tax=Lactiplantibacillus plantarum TaxID=1590 RepID=UPI0032DF4B3C